MRGLARAQFRFTAVHLNWAALASDHKPAASAKCETIPPLSCSPADSSLAAPGRPGCPQRLQPDGLLASAQLGDVACVWSLEANITQSRPRQEAVVWLL